MRGAEAQEFETYVLYGENSCAERNKADRAVFVFRQRSFD